VGQAVEAKGKVPRAKGQGAEAVPEQRQRATPYKNVESGRKNEIPVGMSQAFQGMSSRVQGTSDSLQGVGLQFPKMHQALQGVDEGFREADS